MTTPRPKRRTRRFLQCKRLAEHVGWRGGLPAGPYDSGWSERNVDQRLSREGPSRGDTISAPKATLMRNRA